MSFFTRGGLFTGRRNLLSGRGAFSSPAPATGGGLVPDLTFAFTFNGVPFTFGGVAYTYGATS